jgi:UDP-4-keto-D-FucNAc 4-reductase
VIRDPKVNRRPMAVTGASGFVGQRLLSRLQQDGYPTIALSRRGTGVANARDVVVTDYNNISGLTRSLKGVDVLIHLGARAHQRSEGRSDAELFRQANVVTTLSVAHACIAAGVRRFILVSSIGVNGDSTRGRPFSVDDTPHPVEPYAASKWEAERELSALLRGHAVEYVVLRPPLVYGPGCPGNFGSLVRFVASAPFVPLGALRAPRSFMYVDNLVDALLVAACHPDVSGRTFLLADGRDVSVGEVVRDLSGVLRPSRSVIREVPPWLLSLVARLIGQHQSYAKLAAPLQVDAGEFFRVTGWRAPFDPSDGLRETARQFLRS